MKNLATVVIPCFNVEGFIAECLESVLLQGEVVAETYVVDNNCTDRTMDVVAEWCKKHPEFNLTIRKEEKKGAPAARNNPLANVQTKWVQFLDADDLLEPQKIKGQLLKFPNADIVCGGALHRSILGVERLQTPNPNIALGLIEGRMGITSSNLFRTTMLRRVQGWDESLTSSQEYDLMFRVWAHDGLFKTEEEIRSTIRARASGQISQTNATERWINVVSLRMKMLGVLEQKGVPSEDMRLALQAVFDKVRILFRYDHSAAAEIYDELKKKRFRPRLTPSCSLAYVLASRFLGVVNTEKIIDLLVAIRFKNVSA